MEEKVIEIVSKITKINVNDLSNNKDSDKLWDSISHVEIVLMLENEFGVSFDENDIAQMITLNEILNCLLGKMN
ncbi:MULTISPECIES: acyl carrier protein [unclassified Gilliamella]|uniref:acyl carrier protein n=1 Tax=unclassified Gilliamella TaxID=2685620 RepID=UPI0009BC9835|nr:MULTISPECIES: acyl carrier protein [Gilliamella]QYN42428.1 acyl carrier protein [Gilliamella sp. ESL0443]